MRLWSIHPAYLDAKGLVALWREALLAQKVLLGKTKGYTNHPQLLRFKECSDSVGAIAMYLKEISNEADARGYNFDKSKIEDSSYRNRIFVTKGQLQYEFKHLLNKLENRDLVKYRELKRISKLKAHPLFDVIEGDIADWEIL